MDPRRGKTDSLYVSLNEDDHFTTGWLLTQSVYVSRWSSQDRRDKSVCNYQLIMLGPVGFYSFKPLPGGLINLSIAHIMPHFISRSNIHGNMCIALGLKNGTKEKPREWRQRQKHRLNIMRLSDRYEATTFESKKERELQGFGSITFISIVVHSLNRRSEREREREETPVNTRFQY